VLSLLASSVYSRPAAACGACVCGEEPRPILNLIRDLPLNLVIPLRVLDEAETAPHLERVADDVPVPARVERMAGVWLLSVEQDLEPNSDYRVVRDAGVEAQFTTGSARDTQRPTLASVTSTAGGNGDLCEASVGGQVHLKGADDGAAFNVWVEVEVDINGTATLLSLYYDQDLQLGHSVMGCLGPNELPALDDGAQYPSRVRLRDAAGNTGDWQTFILDVVAEEPAGCGTPSPVAGTSSTAGGGSANTGGTGALNAGGDTSEPNEGDNPARTSKGCGCALGQREHQSFAGIALLACALAAGVRRRQLRL
jgi:hypothetical protein